MSNVIYWGTFLQKYTREHDKYESTPKLNCVGDDSEKPSVAESFIFSGLAGPKSLRVILRKPIPFLYHSNHANAEVSISIPSRFLLISILSHYA